MFAGVDGHAEAQLPEWYAAQRGATDPVSFAEAIREFFEYLLDHGSADEWADLR